jgi:hypothetical protein
MKVLHVTNGPLSGAPYRLAQVQRLGGLESRLLSFPSPPVSGIFPADVLMTGDADEVAHLLEAAEVVHYHNAWRNSRLFELHPWAWQLVRDKTSVIQFHSPRDSPGFADALREPSLVKLVVAQYHVRLFPECLPVPNALPIDDSLHRPRHAENDPPVIAFTPQGCGYGGWHDKGCAATLAVLARGFAHRFVTAAPWEEAMEVRAVCDIAIDEVVTGSYHLCSLEALSQGLATVAGLDTLTVDALERITGTRQHPWIVARPDSLERELRRLVADDGYRRAKRAEARRYMETHWQPQQIAGRFAAIYAAALSGNKEWQ